MVNWNNLDTVKSYEELTNVARVNLAEVMSGENGAERVTLCLRWARSLCLGSD